VLSVDPATSTLVLSNAATASNAGITITSTMAIPASPTWRTVTQMDRGVEGTTKQAWPVGTQVTNRRPMIEVYQAWCGSDTAGTANTSFVELYNEDDGQVICRFSGALQKGLVLGRYTEDVAGNTLSDKRVSVRLKNDSLSAVNIAGGIVWEVLHQ
jgi:hypothetical protein